MALALILRFGLPESKARLLGSGADEQAVVYLAEHFRPGTRIAAWGPGKIWTAKMVYVRMVADLRYMKSAQDVSEWMAREGVKAIYVDDYLRRFEPAVWNTIQRQIGSGLKVVFDGGGGAIQVLVRTDSQ